MGDGIEYFEDGLGLGKYRRKLKNKDWLKLKSYLLCKEHIILGMKARKRWVLYKLCRYIDLKEALEATWDNFDLSHDFPTLNLAKQKVTISDELANEVRKWQDQENPERRRKLFENLDAEKAERMWHKDCRAAGVNL